MSEAADDMWHDAFDRALDGESDGGEFYRGVVTRETDKAVLFHRGGATDGEWIPKSQIINRTNKGIEITFWLADKKGWSQTDADEEIPF